MDPRLSSLLADAILLLHVGVVLFNIFGLVAIPLGAWRGWAFVRLFWWRALHLAVLAIVALQALLDRVCFLTIWQSALLRQAGEPTSAEPLLRRWVTSLLYWPLPFWAFAVVYVAAAIFTLLLWWRVPPHSPRRTARAAAASRRDGGKR